MNLSEILNNPNWLPQSLDPASIVFEEISHDTLTKSAFLDGRALGKTGRTVSVPIDHLLKALPKLQKRPHELHEIFHISHVGSTFIARILGEFGDVRIFREPPILKGLSFLSREYNDGVAPFNTNNLLQLQDLVFTLLIRSHKKNIIKHSSQNLIIPKNTLISKINIKPTLYLYTSLADFLAHSLSSQGLSSDATNGAAHRIKHFNSIASMDRLSLHELSALQRVALVWMSGMIKINLRYRKDKGDLLLNFDKNFSNNKRVDIITVLADHFGFVLKDQDVHKISSSEIWEKSSKHNAKQSYSHRQNIIQENRVKYKDDVRKTIDWVSALTDRNLHLHPLDSFLSES